MLSFDFAVRIENEPNILFDMNAFVEIGIKKQKKQRKAIFINSLMIRRNRREMFEKSKQYALNEPLL